MHPSTKVLFAYGAVGSAKVVRQTKKMVMVHLLFGGKILSWNAQFEYAICKYVWKLGVAPHQFIDVMAIGRMCTLPGSLSGAASALGCKHQKDLDGKRLIRKFCLGKPVDKTDPDWQAFKKYCRQDVRTERAVYHALPCKALTPTEQEVWEVDTAVNERGVRINVPMAKGAVKIIAAMKPKAASELGEISGGLITGPAQRERIKAFCKDNGYEMENLQKPTVAAALTDKALPKRIRRLFEVIAAYNVSSTAKYVRMLGASSGGRVRGVHRMYGADTGRWGGQIAQFQNIPRPKATLGPEVHETIADVDLNFLELYGHPLLVLRDCLRNTLIASEGCELIITDKSSIEARVLGWGAGCVGYQKAYREGLDLYKVTAGVIYKVPYTKVTDDQRFLGKQSVLGLGYSMGAPKFELYVTNTGRKLPKSLFVLAVKTFRKTYPEIPRFWYGVEEAAKKCLRSKAPASYREVKFEMVDHYLTMILPSGRRLWYPHAKLSMESTRYGDREQITFMTSFGNSWFKTSTYGGKLVENWVQAVSRDLLAIALVKIEKAGLKPVLHVHDEIVNDVLKAKMLFAVAFINKVFCTPPPWGKGLILGCDTKTSPYYKK